jgi:hypothetical protein
MTSFAEGLAYAAQIGESTKEKSEAYQLLLEDALQRVDQTDLQAFVDAMVNGKKTRESKYFYFFFKLLLLLFFFFFQRLLLCLCLVRC